jgi:hypothetical protein
MPSPIPEIICYCFNYNRRDIEEDILRNGRSLILDKILDAKCLGACQCTIKNPKGA